MNILEFSEQTDSRAERILEICRKIALDQSFNSLLQINFNFPASQFNSPVQVQNDNFEKKAETPIVIPTVNYPVDPSGIIF